MLDQQINCLIKRFNVRSKDQQTITHINFKDLDQHIKSEINKSKARSTDQKSEQQKKCQINKSNVG